MNTIPANRTDFPLDGNYVANVSIIFQYNPKVLLNDNNIGFCTKKEISGFESQARTPKAARQKAAAPAHRIGLADAPDAPSENEKSAVLPPRII
ncbi:hypothetical protein J2Z19_005408 [Ensifer adhaerens]|uniref:Uncharacterized protein n=1 Tax=Ensifer adhaerens TaxID=106592 RepID=A0ACC5T3F8_ENSAD|nr:hypothetical protein [Ensifer adhaerens]MBP1875671.1 hypothetical protein [Ensifer adhaerens]